MIIGKSKKTSNLLLIINIIFIFLLIAYLYTDPIKTVYMSSCIISYFTQTSPFLDKNKYFPNSILFKQKWKDFRLELNNLLEQTNNGKDIRHTRTSFGNQNAIIGSDADENRAWRIYHIRLGKSFTKHGLKNFPILCKTLEKCPEVVACSISIIDEKTYIPMHVGYFKGVIRYMLALKVPKEKDKCFLCVNGQKYVWTEGEDILWDDIYPHRVENNTLENRVVIYMDVKRPLNKILSHLRDFTLNLMEGSKTVQDEIKKSELRKKIEN
jgi:beta-hydroxylase